MGLAVTGTLIQNVTSRRHLGTVSGVWSRHTPSQAGDKFTEQCFQSVNRAARVITTETCQANRKSVTQTAYLAEQSAKC